MPMVDRTETIGPWEVTLINPPSREALFWPAKSKVQSVSCPYLKPFPALYFFYEPAGFKITNTSI